MAALNQARRLVVKIGSALLVDRAHGHLRFDWLTSLAKDVAEIKARGTDVVLVSSGSIALGRRVLALPDGTLELEKSQAAAAVGQIQLARAYEQVLAPHEITTAQVLVTLEDSADRRRYLNMRSTMETLLSLGAVPIVNENDTIATDEIRYGDNDRLAAQVAATVGADQLVLLSDVDGFYSANPHVDPTAKRFDVIHNITPEIEMMAGDGVSGLSKGGMKTKLMAAKTCVAAGCSMVITEGSVLSPLRALEQGAPCTWFMAMGNPHDARKRWISSMKPMGSIIIDDGAVRALMQGKSLLPAGVISVSGQFQRGDMVTILDTSGRDVGHGLTAYAVQEATALIGCNSSQIEKILGYSGRSALVHRDDMAI